MSPRILLLSAVLGLAALAMLPSAQAAVQPPPIVVCVTEPCPGPVPTVDPYCTAKALTPGQNPYTTVNLRERVWGTDAGCDIDADTTDLYACAPPSGFVIERTVGPVHAKVLVCDGGAGSTPIASAQGPIVCVMAPCGPCTCPPPVIDVNYCKLEAITPGPLRGALWGSDPGCDIDVETNWYCLYDEVPVDRTVGPVHVKSRVCTPPLPPINWT
jgi:hypothetical protein